MFKGFPDDTLKYFRDIARNNNRSWYLKNKDRYVEKVQKPAQELVSSLNEHKIFRKLGLSGNVKNPLFRMARDTRFSSDKTLYKIYNGFSLSRSGLRGDLGVFYFHLQPKECFFACGFWQPDPKFITRVRLRAVENPKNLKSLLQNLKRHKLELSSEDTLVRLPRGFEYLSDPVLQKFLRLKSYILVEEFKESELGRSQLVEQAAKFTLKSQALLKYLWPVVDAWRIEGGDVDFQEKLMKSLNKSKTL